MMDEQRRKRRERWLRLTSLLPPEERGFTPRNDDSEEAPILLGEKPLVVRRQAWPLGSGPFHNNPGWDNVIRAYEEDR